VVEGEVVEGDLLPGQGHPTIVGRPDRTAPLLLLRDRVHLLMRGQEEVRLGLAIICI
jgi:hypothetical protein